MIIRFYHDASKIFQWYDCVKTLTPWWRHQMETFSALLAICAGNSPVPGKFPSQRPVTRSFDGFVDLRLNKRLSKQSWGWWFETLSYPLWRHCNAQSTTDINRGNLELKKKNILNELVIWNWKYFSVFQMKNGTIYDEGSRNSWIDEIVLKHRLLNDNTFSFINWLNVWFILPGNNTLQWTGCK